MFSREDERRWMPEIYEPAIAIRMHFAVQHGGNLARIFCVTSSEGIASRDRLRQTQVDVFKQLHRRASVMIELREHESMEGVVYCGRNFRGYKAMSFSIDN